MNIKNGVTGIVFAEKDGEKYFLLLHRVLNWKGWEFPKGGIEEGEKAEEAVLREVGEETGLKELEIVGKVPEKMEWTASDVNYIYNVFLIKGNMEEEVKLQEGIKEHDSFEWVEKGKVTEILTHKENKENFCRVLELIGG
ncbi:MAG: NUDIX domain-containing protein [Candidatus Diapherotrites archaeon]